MLKRIQRTSAFLIGEETVLSANKILWHYLFGILLLLLSGWKVYHGLEGAMDIQFADESAYLRFGLDLFGKMNRDWGPLYSLWYKTLSLISNDTIQLYYLNYAFTSILVGVLLYIFLLRISIHPLLSFIIAFSVLISELNISVWPRISHFCIALCLLFLIIISFLKSNVYKFLTFTLLCLLCSYARPEFYISFLLSLFASILCITYQRKQLHKSDYALFLIIFLVILLLHFLFRFPSNNFFGYNRGVAAFYQHYAYNFKLRTHANIDSWLYWEEISKQQFGDCNSIWCVIKSQPTIFLDNTLFNIKNYMISTITHCFSYIFPIGIFYSKKIQLLTCAILTIIIISQIVQKKSREQFIDMLIQLRFYLIILFLFISPTILSCIFVFPREHYIYLQMLLFVVLLAALLNFSFNSFSPRPTLFALLGILMLLSVPNTKDYKFLTVNNNTPYLSNKELTYYLEKNYSDKPHTIFTNMPFVRGMLPENFNEINTIFDKKKNIPFKHYMDSAKIDIVIITPSTLRDPHICFDSTWVDFTNNYTNYKFRKEYFNKSETYLLIKQ